MLRVISKRIPVKKVTWKPEDDAKLKLYRTVQYFENGSFRVPLRCYSKNVCPDPPKASGGGSGGGGVGKFILGALALGGGTLGYAKYDEDFRQTLTEYVPFTDSLIKHLFLEVSVLETISSYYDSLKSSSFGSSSNINIEPIPPPKEYKAPPPISPSLEKPVKQEQSYTEIRLETKDKTTAEPNVEIVGEVKPEIVDVDVEGLERKICEAATDAVNAYNRATYNLKKYNQEIAYVIEEAVNKVQPDAWQSVKDKSRVKQECIKIAEDKAVEATKTINDLKCMITSSTFKGSAATREIIKANINKVQEDISKAKAELEKEKKAGGVTEKYWEKVEAARKHFSEQLEVLFPNIDIGKKQMKIDPDELDLFVLHTYANVLFYQKELAKMETIMHDKVQKAVDAARKGGGEPLTDAQICEALQEEKKKLALCFQQECLKLKKEAECDMREQMKLQSQAFSDHLKEAIDAKASEIERTLVRQFDEKLEAEKCRYKYQLATMVGRLRGLDQSLKAKADADASAKRAQVLWSACQALVRSLRAGCPGQNWKDQVRPLNPEIKAIQKAAAENDELVSSVIAGIPKEAKDRGVYPEDALRERFLKVEEVARKVALVPEQGASLPVHILSYIQSMLLVKAASPIPQAELDDCAVDFSKLNTIDILQRARYWLDRGDFAQTLKYMNLLKGAPRCVAKQWMNETRIMLETQQAANTLMAYAASSGLMYL